jgi:hypothetical protein
MFYKGQVLLTRNQSPGSGDAGGFPSRPVRFNFRAYHTAFYRRQPADAPVIGFYRHSIYPMQAFISGLPSREIMPEDVSPDRWLSVYEQAWEQTGLMWGELLHWESPLNGFPWMEAIAGCPVYARQESLSVWAGERNGYHLGDDIRFDDRSGWCQALLENTRALAKLSDGRFPVAPGIMRGISDLMASLLGSERFYLALYDQQEMAGETAAQLADLWIDVVRSQYTVIPAFSGGYANAGLWFPGHCPVYQDDASALISAKLYEQVIGPSARRVLEAFPYPMMHFHSAGLQFLPSILLASVPVVIEVNIDPSGPPVEELIPVFRGVQQAAPLELFGSPAVILACLEALAPAGLAGLILEPEPEEPDA